jgi:hypothetical protein
MTIQSPLDDVEFLLRDLIVLHGDAEYVATTLWIAHTYGIPAFDFSPRLAIWSPEKRCGKSLSLEIVGNLNPNSRMTSSITSAALFRSIAQDETRVALIDESDTVFGKGTFSEKAEDLRSIINQGYKRGSVVSRCDKNSLEVKDFLIFSPVALAGIGISAIPETIADRAVVIEMRRKLKNQKIREYESDEVEDVFGLVRDNLAKWVQNNFDELRKCRPVLPTELNSRARDIWKPLFKIAYMAGDEWINKAISASLALSDKRSEPDDISMNLRLLMDIRTIFRGEKLSSKEIIASLLDLSESPWRYLQSGFNENALAKMLRNYGISSKNFGSIRGYTRTSFEDSWKRYLDPEEPVNAVNAVNVQIEQLLTA